MKNVYKLVTVRYQREDSVRGAHKNKAGKACLRRAVKKVARALDRRMNWADYA